jgi:hypothetical protein
VTGVTNDSPRNDRRAILAGVVATLMSGFGLVAQALALATARFQPTLNGDYVLAHAFTREVFVSSYPISGWKFGMGSFAFPDYAIYWPWFAVFGDSGLSYAAYAVTLWLGYFGAFAWVLRSAGARWGVALATSGIALNLVLATRLLSGGYADRLWQLSLPAYHGGNLLLELYCFALVFGAVRAGRWSRVGIWALGVFAALGIFSNAQLLLHMLIPVGALLWLFRGLRPVFSGYTRAVIIGLAVAVMARVALALAEVFFFAKLFKTWPLPTLMWEKLLKLAVDFRTELFPEAPVLWCVALAGVFGGVVMAVRSRRTGDIAGVFVPTAIVATLVAVMATPVAAVYWKDAGSARYLLPWFILPTLLLALAAIRASRRVKAVLGVVGLAAVACFGVRAVPEIRREALLFPRPPEALALREWVRANNLNSGLCHFWENQLLQTEWGYEGPRLSNIRDKDFCEFWCNNAFGYFPTHKGDFAYPGFDFVILNHLDPEVLRERLGGDFTPVAIGPYSVVKLTPEQARRASALVERQALDFLAGRRADFLKARLSEKRP